MKTQGFKFIQGGTWLSLEGITMGKYSTKGAVFHWQPLLRQIHQGSSNEVKLTVFAIFSLLQHLEGGGKSRSTDLN